MTDTRMRLAALCARLLEWLAQDAYPLWAASGVDPRNGGFVETLEVDGTGLPHPRRARIHPRQVYAFAQAGALGWQRDCRELVGRGLEYFVTHYRRDDGLYRTLADVDGVALDERAVLYDQAFALLGFAAAATALDALERCELRALELRAAIAAKLAAGEPGVFRSREDGSGPLESNPHMHLLEACLAWAEIGRDPGWADWARHIVEVALTRFIDRDSGALFEAFDSPWRPAAGLAGRIVEPGHQFEWAWLLLRAEALHGGGLRPAALRLIEIGEHHGVRDGFAVNALLEDLSIHDGNARFWPQTERLKAAVLAARRTDRHEYWTMAESAATSVLAYLRTPLPGLWNDVRRTDGVFIHCASPASSFYHLVGAVVALDTSLKD